MSFGGRRSPLVPEQICLEAALLQSKFFEIYRALGTTVPVNSSCVIEFTFLGLRSTAAGLLATSWSICWEVHCATLGDDADAKGCT